MNDQNDSSPSMLDDMRTTANWTMTLVDGVAWSWRVFWRHRLGAEQPGLGGAISLVLMLLFTGCGGPGDPRPMLAFALLFLLVCLLRRFGAVARYYRRDEEHSFCSGYSYLPRVVPFVGETFAVTLLEPLLSSLIALAILPFAPMLGGYLLFAAVCLFLSENAIRAVQLRRLKRMRDQYIQQRNIARAFRAYINHGTMNT